MSAGASLGVGGSQGFGASTPLGASSNAMGASANGGAGVENLQSFPQLSIPELLSVLSEMGTPASSEEMSKPTPEFAAKVFGAFLEALNGVTGKWIERQRDAICGQLEYRELYEEGVHHMLLFREIRAMMTHATIHDFAMADLTKPTPKRFKNHLSALSNFWRFSQDRVIEFDDAARDGDQLLDRREDLVKNVDALRNDLHHQTEQRAAEQPKVLALRDENARLSDKLLGLKKEQGTLMQEHDVFKTEKGDLTQKLLDLQFKLNTAIADIRRYQNRAIESPNKLREMLSELEERYRQDKISLGDSQRKIRELQEKQKVLQGVETETKTAQSQLQRVLEQTQKYAQEEAAREHALATFADNQRARDEIELKKDLVARRLASLTQRIERLNKSIETRRAEEKKRAMEVEAEFDRLSKEKGKRSDEEKAKVQEADAYEKEYTDLMRAYDAHVAYMKQESEVIKARAREYMSVIRQKLNVQV